MIIVLGHWVVKVNDGFGKSRSFLKSYRKVHEETVYPACCHIYFDLPGKRFCSSQTTQ